MFYKDFFEMKKKITVQKMPIKTLGEKMIELACQRNTENSDLSVILKRDCCSVNIILM